MAKVESKETKEKSVDEVKLESDKKHLIEMTAEQGADFAEFIALKEREKKALEAQANQPKVRLNLGFQHRRNGKAYGPGSVDVPEEIAGSLEAADQVALQMKLRENQSNDHLFQVMARGVQRRMK